MNGPARRIEFRFPWRRDREIARDVADEIRFHLESRIADLVAAGLSRAEAEREARRRFGDPGEAARDLRRLDRRAERGLRRHDRLDQLGLLVRQVTRQFVGAPLLSAVAVLTLGLGVGASTALYAVVHRLYLTPLPYPAPEQLVELSRGLFAFSGQGFQIRAALGTHPAFESLALYYPGGSSNLGAATGTIHVGVAQVSDNFFQVLALPLHLGHGLAPGTERAGETSVVLSYPIWRAAFGADSSVIGRRILVNGVPREVVGVAGAEFAYPAGADLWLPLPLDFGFFGEATGPSIIARLAPGVDRRTGTAMIRDLYRDETGAVTNPGELHSLTETLVGSSRQALWTALAATICILLIGTVNVANLLLVRLGTRSREFGIRRALGAQSAQVVAQVAAEVAALGLVAGLAGIGAAWIGLRVLLAAMPQRLPLAAGAGLNGPVLAFAGLLTLAIIVVVGVLTGLRVSTGGGGSRPGGRIDDRGEGPGWRAVRSGLMVAEVAVAFLLVVAAGLFVQSYQALQATDLGLEPRGVLAFRMQLPEARFPGAGDQARFVNQLERELSSLPGVTSVGVTTNLPLSEAFGAGFSVVSTRGDRIDTVSALVRYVTPTYFASVGQAILRGTPPTVADTGAGLPLPGAVSQRLAAQLWPGEEPIGRRLVIPMFRRGGSSGEVVVTAVVRDVRHHGAREEPGLELFLPYRSDANFRQLFVAMRTPGDPRLLAAPARAILTRLDPTVAPYDLETLTAAAARVEARSRFLARVIGAFAILALGLAVMGVYGVVAQSARSRTRELAIRLAVGAPPSSVLRSLSGWALRYTALGLLLGLGGALAAARLVEGLLYGLSPLDPGTLLGVAALLLLATWLSCLPPARTVRRVATMRVLADDT